MQFEIGPFVFRVLVVRDRPVDDSGEASDELTRFDALVIEIWAGLGPERRENVLLHALRHVWRWHHGSGEDMEEDCVGAAAWAQWLMDAYVGQGGRAALGVMGPGDACQDAGLVEAVKREPMGRQKRQERQELRLVPVVDEMPERLEERLGGGLTADCAGEGCGLVYHGAAVVTGLPYWLDAIGGRVINGEVVERMLYCEECGHVQWWVEGWDVFRRVPNGVAVVMPELQTGSDAVAKWDLALADQRSRSSYSGGAVG